MKKQALFLLCYFVLSFSINTNAQQQNPAHRTCGTAEWLEAMKTKFPGFKTQYETGEKKLGEAMTRRAQHQDANRANTLNVTIPIVFHVVLPAPQQALLTDAMIMAQLTRLNLDYAGLNADSSNIPAEFQAVRGHSVIQFCLAKRTPAGFPATGIVRVVSATVSEGPSADDPVKSTARGGSDAWDPTKYFNVWLTNFDESGSLGYASFPIGSPEDPTWGLNQQGVVVLAQSVPGGSATRFNGGRTLVHEAGHYFWLRHINGDAACGEDFPTTLSLDDTPKQASLSAGCPGQSPVVVAVPSGCPESPNPPGKMFQNYMDYTDDACYSMFTKGQVLRAEQAINTFRPGYLTSNGCIPVVLLNNDAKISTILYPVNGSFNACSPINPQVTLINFGANTLTSATINVILNGTSIGFQNWSGTLASGQSTNITLTAVPVTPALGSNILKIHSTNPNGVPDTGPANDTATSVFTFTTGITFLPPEGFETLPFPPAGWSETPDPVGSARKWVRVNTGKQSNWSIKADFWNYPEGTTFSINTPYIKIVNNPAININFDISHRQFLGSDDRLQVQVSKDCGLSWTTVYDKNSSTGLTTVAGTPDAEFIPTVTSDWKTESALVTGSILSGGPVLIRWLATSDYGNNLFVDNINIELLFNRDLQVVSIDKPLLVECSGSFTPQATVKNVGVESITGFNISYSIDNGPSQTTSVTGINLARNATMLVNLTPAVAGVTTGQHTIKVFSANPVSASGTGDQQLFNDTLVKTFGIAGTIAAPLTEGFETTAFPPANWAIANADAGITWSKATVGKNSSGSAYIRNFAYSQKNRVDELYSPVITYTGVDSVQLSFDLAAVQNNTTVDTDTLEVLITSNCGATFTSVWKKWGPELQTITGSLPAGTEFIPNNLSQWRTEVIDLTVAYAPNGPIQVVFRNTNNNVNNIYIDNVNLSTRVLPATLKSQGYLILPNPFHNQFTVWHLRPPTTLRHISIYNTAGQLVWQRQYAGNAANQVTVDLTGKPAGLYIINLGYTDKHNVQEKIIKQ